MNRRNLRLAPAQPELCRHFPTREALVEAAYRDELDRLCDAAPEPPRAPPPDQATRARPP